MSFGENLINLRRQKGWSQDDLANNLNISRQAISKWENNTSKPDVDNIEKISKIFSVKIDELLNNELPNDKAVALDVKKEEKKEKTITIVKLMIIAVIILYAISVIYKFASLLVIVNGVQKYSNLNNYHYVITTYEDNELTQKEESWFKDGVSKTVNTIFSKDNSTETVTCIDYNEKNGYIKNKDNTLKINVEEYSLYQNGKQMINKLPITIRKIGLQTYLSLTFQINKIKILFFEEGISIITEDNILNLNKDTLLPMNYCYNNENKIIYYDIEIGKVDNLQI